MKNPVINHLKLRRPAAAALALTAVSALALTGCGSADEQEASADGVTKVLVAHDQAYTPYDYVDENGVSDGYEVAVLRAVDELLPQYEFEYVGTTNDDLLIGLESGKYDVGVKGVWWTEERSTKFVFPEHYIGSSIIGIVIRTEDADEITDLESFAAYSGKLVPIGAQNAQYTIIANYNKNHPDQQIDLIAGDEFLPAEGYQWVVEGRYDAHISIKTSFEANVLSEDGEYHDYADQLTFVTYEAIPTWPLFNIDNQELADAYDEAWETLEENGTLDELQQQYFGYSLFDAIPEGYTIGDEL